MRFPYRWFRLLPFALALGVACSGDCGPGGMKDRARQMLGRGPKIPGEFYLAADPPGAIRGAHYKGEVYFRDDPDKPIFTTLVSVQPSTQGRTAATNIKVTKKSDKRLAVEFDLDHVAAPTEQIVLVIEHKYGTSGGQLHLRTVDPTWNPEWKPVAVAPGDTSITAGTSLILDAGRSRHPGGSESLRYRWRLDDGRSLMGSRVPVTLDAGTHEVTLEAEDRFGNRAYDKMRVQVLP